MKLLISIDDLQGVHLLELLKSFKVEARQITYEDNEPSKEEILEGLKSALQEVRLVEEGKLKRRTKKDLFNALHG